MNHLLTFFAVYGAIGVATMLIMPEPEYRRYSRVDMLITTAMFWPISWFAFVVARCVLFFCKEK